MFGAHPPAASVQPRSQARRIKISHQLARVLGPPLPIRQRNLGCDERHTARVSDDAGRLAACVLLNSTAKRVGSVLIDLARFQRSSVEVAMVIDGLQDHRVGGSDAIQFLEREPARLVAKLLLRPTAQSYDPIPRMRATDAVCKHFQNLFARRHAVEPHFLMPMLRSAYEV